MNKIIFIKKITKPYMSFLTKSVPICQDSCENCVCKKSKKKKNTNLPIIDY